ncbi:hypothetical protein BMETH_27391853392247, partial [methanotrophic bacterial endosymbiont of Bathymodiolus sp.]
RRFVAFTMRAYPELRLITGNILALARITSLYKAITVPSSTTIEILGSLAA